MWKDLSLKDKAELIKLAVNNGITDLSTIRDTYNKFEEGGSLDGEDAPKVGPTYNPETHRWTNPYGKDITGKSFEGDWGITTYLDSGAVELDTREEDNPKKRYIYRYADNAKRVYIGGNTNEVRQEYFNRDKELTEAVKASSKKHGISANLLASRIAKEGPIDEAIKNYNNTNGYFQRGRLVGPLWGLDDMGTMISEGTVKIDPEMVVNTDHEFQNEKGRTTYSVDSDNYLDGVELTAVALKYYKDEMKKRYPKASDETLEQYANAAFNMGISEATKTINEGRIVNAYKPFINIKNYGGFLQSRKNKFGLGGIKSTENNIDDAELAEEYKRFEWKVERGDMTHEEALNEAKKWVEKRKKWEKASKESEEVHKKRLQYEKELKEGKVKPTPMPIFPSSEDYSKYGQSHQLNHAANIITESLQPIDMSGIADLVEDSRERYVEEKKEEWYPYKLWLESAATAAELISGAYTLGRLAHASNIGRNNRILNKLYGWDKGQMLANSLGATADGYQLLTSDNLWDTTENSLELTGGIAGIIGGTNWFRRTPLFGRYGNKIDDILDYTGYTAAGYDIFGKPIISTTKDVVERAYPDSRDKNQKE